MAQINDRWVWLGLGVFLFAAAKGIAYALQDIRELNEIPESDEPSQRQSPESSIALSALRTLTESTNPDIAQSARTIILNRFALDRHNVDAWTDDLFSLDPRLRTRANKLRPLVSDINVADWREGTRFAELATLLAATLESHDEAVNSTIRRAYQLAVDGLKDDQTGAYAALNSLDEELSRAHFDGDRPLLHAAPNLASFREGDVAEWADRERWRLAVRARHRARPRFGSRLMRAMRSSGLDADTLDYVERSVIAGEDMDGNPVVIRSRVAMVPEVTPASVAIRALLRPLEEGFRDGNETEEVDSSEGDESDRPRVAASGFHGPPRGGRVARFHEESPEETEIRRRRREAMVLHEGGGSIGREDIFQPMRPQ